MTSPYFSVSDEASRTRKTIMYQRVFDLTDKLADFVTEHYCPKAMNGKTINDFYAFASVLVEAILEGISIADKLRELDMLDYAKEKILGKKADPKIFKIYTPTLADMTRLVWMTYHNFVYECIYEERMMAEAKEEEEAEEKQEEKPGKKSKKKSKEKKSGG